MSASPFPFRVRPRALLAQRPGPGIWRRVRERTPNWRTRRRLGSDRRACRRKRSRACSVTRDLHRPVCSRPAEARAQGSQARPATITRHGAHLGHRAVRHAEMVSARCSRRPSTVGSGGGSVCGNMGLRGTDGDDRRRDQQGMLGDVAGQCACVLHAGQVRFQTRIARSSCSWPMIDTVVGSSTSRAPATGSRSIATAAKIRS